MLFLQGFFSFLVNFQNSSYSIYLYSFHQRLLDKWDAKYIHKHLNK